MINSTYYTTSMISTSTTRSHLSMNNHSNETYPSSYCSCCCTFSLNSTKLLLPLPLNPNLVCPPRQSSLIHWAPPSRLLLGLGGGYGFRRPGCDVGRCYFGDSCCGREDMMWGWSYGVKCCGSKEGVGFGSKRGRGRGRIGRSGYRSNALGDVEAILSLLAKETVETGRSLGRGGRVVEEHVVCEEFDDRKNGLGENEEKKLGLSHEGRGEVERLSMREDLRSRRKESSSSYYSLSDFEIGDEDEVEREEFVGESSIIHGNDLSDSRKVGTVVIREDSRKDSKRYSDRKDQQLRGSSVLDRSKVGSSTDWDWRKKSEKKLDVELAVETKYKKDSVLQQSHSSEVSSSKKHFNPDERESISGVNSHWQSWSHIKRNDQENANSKSGSRQQQVPQTNVNDAGRIARSRSEVGDGVMMQEKNSESETQQHGEFSDSRDTGRWTVAGQSESNNEVRKQEKSSVSLQGLLGGPNQEQQMIHVRAGQVNSGRKSQYYNEMVGTNDRYDESTLRTRRHLESRIKNVEEQSTSQTGLSASQAHSSNTEIGNLSVSQQRLYDERAFLASRLKSVEEEIAKQKSINERTRPMEAEISRTGVQQLSKVEGRSDVHFTNMQSGGQSSSRKEIHDELASLMLRLKSVEEVGEKQHEIGERLLQSSHESEVHGHVRQAGLAQSPSEKATGTQPMQSGGQSSSRKQIDEEQASLILRLKSVEEAGEKQNVIEERLLKSSHDSEMHGRAQQAGLAQSPPEKATGTQPSLTLVSQTPVQQVSQVEDTTNMQISVVGPSYQFIEGSKYGQPSSSYDAHGSGGLSYEESSPSDALGSVTRMEETSNQFVGEFVEKMRHDASTSDEGTAMMSQIGSSNEDNNPDVKTRLRKQRSRRSSGGSGTKGLSDEMWDAKDHFPQAPSEDSAPKRTGKSLWNVVAGVFRWGRHSETQKSPDKTSGRNSSIETASGQTWFSGNDHDEANGDSLRTKQSNMSEQSTSSGVVLAGSLSGGVCVGASTDTNFIQQTPQSTPSLESSISPARHFRSSDGFEEIEEADPSKGVISSTKKQKEDTVSVRPDGGSSEASDVELKQRKLQRSKQFEQERFEEWEDAYRLENEQRKVDEIFMREALVEARKASDSWEVPVGAVLVHNGKIIARGYNLVEELRDSTAHAEMICIREASSVLKTWRLSETTLYVTLEPCPMCAGAILQARVGTVVWGAPNKLLGADGSWIRLFPDGLEGEQCPEVSNKPAAPVHPFHPKMKVRRGVLDAECAGIMQEFFKLRRKKEKEKKEKGEEALHSSCLPVPHRPRFFHKMHGAFHFLFGS